MKSDYLIEAQDISMRFGGVHALTKVNFTLERKELRCLIGPNGAGKSTFFKILSGQQKPSSGQLWYAGKAMVGRPTYEFARMGMGIKNQLPSVLDGLSIQENIYLALSTTHGSRKPQSAECIWHLLEQVGLDKQRERLVGELAHGQRQWIEIAMVLAGNPELVLLDEPAAGMSDDETGRTAELIRAMTEHAAVIVVEHDMAFIRSIAKKVTVFHQGHILMEDSFDAVVRDVTVRNVYLGRSASC
ncbi:ATP-binding cassette domain-containing protein [Alcaligenes endophyticus]|uniref:ATP-binding cassette domain-containing protein n=1 Tax=Alcaligenes endophyticus TaxID=1929088 RepID=A0ABT8EMN9_9BURK|nr:ATP-binding cassette domain-containing protein [Alcaligenes endophyticus]MCX5590961.1 ATP-binding cassette domain-containing protein [Alcaligenes endophyticus]MDN4122462.1 ATP-binding cassette domain-containing protein [Alcaligenes endophyticus]